MYKMRLTAIYKSTVIPITYCTVTLSVYSRGYSDRMESLLYNREIPFLKYATALFESSLVGYCIGIMYPVGIPAAIGYLYLTDT